MYYITKMAIELLYIKSFLFGSCISKITLVSPDMNLKFTRIKQKSVMCSWKKQLG